MSEITLYLQLDNWFRGGLVFKAHRLLYHSSVGSRVMQRKTKYLRLEGSRSKLGRRRRVSVQGYLAHKKLPPS